MLAAFLQIGNVSSCFLFDLEDEESIKTKLELI